MDTKPTRPQADEPSPPLRFDDLRSAAGNEQLLETVRSSLMADIGDRLRYVRGRRPRGEVAGWLCVHENTIGKIERGEAMPDCAQLMVLAAMFQRPLLWLLGYEEPEPVDPVQEPKPRYSLVPPPRLKLLKECEELVRKTLADRGIEISEERQERLVWGTYEMSIDAGAASAASMEVLLMVALSAEEAGASAPRL
jgi:hypothetical protein